MKSGTFRNTNYHVFKKWGRRSYSLFSVLRKVVKISVLPIVYLISLPLISSASEKDTAVVRITHDLDEVEVTATRSPLIYSEIARILSVIEHAEIQKSPAQSVQDLLENIAGVDIRQRGAEGVQADVSIRGGSFDQTLILLNGINITDPQTGHHNLNLPVSLSQIDRIEVLEGPAARVYGPNAFSGAINIVTKKPEGFSVQSDLSAGSFGYLSGNLSGSIKTGNVGHLVAVNRKSANGYIQNTDFEDTNLFYSAEMEGKEGKIAAQAGIGGKGFGANSFYSPLYPEQFEKTGTRFAALSMNSTRKMHLAPALYWRQHLDKFMLFRDEAPEWYLNHNYHRTDVRGAKLNSWFLWKAGKTVFGTEFRSEKIWSNVLGENMEENIKVKNEDAFYTKSKARNITSFFLEHAVFAGSWSFSAGVMANSISDYGEISFFPGIDVSCQFSPAVKMFASWNTSMRMPTFTDLYYSGPVNRGNSELKPEKTAAAEAGIKYSSPFIQGHALLFHRIGKNLIDWVKESENDEIWQSMNHTRIISSGTEIQIEYQPKKHLEIFSPDNIKLSYFFNNQQKENENLISYYVLDNIRHKIVASVNQSFTNQLSAEIACIYQKREGTFGFITPEGATVETPYAPFWLTHAKILYRLNSVQFYVSANNLFNVQYFDLGNVVQPGLWIKAGISLDLKMK